MNFNQAFELLTSPEFEGGYANNQHDSGGQTMWGITEKTARRHGYTGQINELPKSWAKKIYQAEYWNTVRADEMPHALRYALFDAAVNSGPHRAILWLQQALGVKADGIIGQITLRAVTNEIIIDYVLRKMIANRLKFMSRLDEWKHFGRGWARRIARVMEL